MSAITKKQAASLRSLINRRVAAEIAYAWKGGGDPADIPLIEAELAYWKLKLNHFIDSLRSE